MRLTLPLSLMQVLVEYIDYGNEEVVDKTMLRPGLDMELFSLPPQVTVNTVCVCVCVCVISSQHTGCEVQIGWNSSTRGTILYFIVFLHV